MNRRRIPPVVTGAEVAKHGIVTGASYATKGEMPYRGPGEKLLVTVTEDPTLTACRAFIECVRTKQQPVANARVGLWIRHWRGHCESCRVRGGRDP